MPSPVVFGLSSMEDPNVAGGMRLELLPRDVLDVNQLLTKLTTKIGIHEFSLI